MVIPPVVDSHFHYYGLGIALRFGGNRVGLAKGGRCLSKHREVAEVRNLPRNHEDSSHAYKVRPQLLFLLHTPIPIQRADLPSL